MAIQQDHGKWGEDLARAYLETQGLAIVECNWRYKRAEVDLICREGKVLVFVEVKTRSNTAFGKPEERIGARKKRMLIDAAMAYMRSVGHEWEIRFDIISVTGRPGQAHAIMHFRDAFFPGLGYL